MQERVHEEISCCADVLGKINVNVTFRCKSKEKTTNNTHTYKLTHTMKARDLKTFLFYFLKFVIYTIIIRRRVVAVAFKLHSLVLVWARVTQRNAHTNTVKRNKCFC